ncbi:MAG TPA: anti-sigma factor [Candidatus Limnocylindrales bacterium]
MSGMPLSHDEVRDLAGGFVLGALEPAEEAAVREHLRTCDEPHPEFAELGGVVPYLAESGDFDPVEPPAALRDRIMAAAAAEGSAATSTGSTAAALPAAAPIPFPGASERAARRGRTSPLDWAFRIAAVVAIAALAGWNLLLQQDLGRAREYDNAVASVVAAAGEPGSQTVILTPAEGASARGIAAVRDDGSVVLALRDLAATSGTQVYETWLIVGDAAPVAVGGFTVGADGTGTFTTEPADAPPGAVVALTLEPNAGNTAPMGPVVASGVAIAPTS